VGGKAGGKLSIWGAFPGLRKSGVFVAMLRAGSTFGVKDAGRRNVIGLKPSAAGAVR